VNRGSAIEVVVDGARVPELPGLVGAAAEGPGPDGTGGPAGAPVAAVGGAVGGAVDELTVRRDLGSGDGRISGRVAAAGAAAGAGYWVRWRDPDPAGGIRPGSDVRELPLPSGARLVRTGGAGEEVLATYHTGPDRWVAVGTLPGEPAGPVTG